jgi:hypothetical protein
MRTITTWALTGQNTQNGGFLPISGKFSGDAATRVKQAERGLIERLHEELGGQVPDELFQKAVLEAEALAWTTAYPLLFLPGLAEEKISSVRQWVKHQREVQTEQRIFATAE